MWKELGCVQGKVPWNGGLRHMGLNTFVASSLYSGYTVSMVVYYNNDTFSPPYYFKRLVLKAYQREVGLRIEKWMLDLWQKEHLQWKEYSVAFIFLSLDDYKPLATCFSHWHNFLFDCMVIFWSIWALWWINLTQKCPNVNLM